MLFRSYDVTPTYKGSRKTLVDRYGWPIIYKEQRGKYWGKLNGPVSVRNTYVSNPDYKTKNLVTVTYSSTSGQTYKYYVHKANQSALLTVLKTLDTKNLLPDANIQANPNPRDTTSEEAIKTGISSGILSGHAFGISIDVNSSEFDWGENGYQRYLTAVKSPSDSLYKKAQVIKAFIDSKLFHWGGDFQPPTPKDAMHFTIRPYNI